MYCLTDFCCICFYNKTHLQPLSNFDSDNITYFIKLTSLVPDMCFNEMNDRRLVCSECCKTMNAAYKFQQRCLRSKIMLTDYISQLHQVSKIRGSAYVYVTDVNKFGNIKKQYVNENNIKKTEMLINVNETANEEHLENNPFSLKEIKTERIQFENVVIEMEQQDQFFEENEEVNPLVNQDDIKIGVSQNDILTTSVVKKENETQDFVEHLHKRCDNIMETCNNDNNDMDIKVEENYDYSLYSEKCADGPSINLDELKIDIVDNNIESVNSEIITLYKSENIEEFSKDHVIPLENDDEADKDVNAYLTAMQETSTSNSSKLQDTDSETVKKIRSHMIMPSGSKQFECDICAKKFNYIVTLRHHMKLHSGDQPHECIVCHQKFIISSVLKRHMRTHTGEKLLECSVCQKKFTCLSALKTHNRSHTGEKPYQCSVCQRKFSQLINLSRHEKMHTGEKPYECSVCHKKFIQSSNLREHMRIHTGERPHECDICNKKFICSFALKIHIRIHTGEKPHECDICQKKFACSSTLKKHKRSHTGEKPYECTVCQKKFACSSDLKKHFRIHIGEKPHECCVCQKKFIYSYALKKHMKIHSGEKPYECSVCQKKFVKSSNLKDHMRIHTGEKPHGCSVCQKKFIKSSDLKVHIRRRH